MGEVTINWFPQPRQLELLRACGLGKPFTDEELHPAIADVFGYGGSAGGGKSDALLMVGFLACLLYPKIKVAYFRREFPQLEGLGGAIPRSLEIFGKVAKYNQQLHRWHFPEYSYLQFFHCKNLLDVYNYQSQQFDILLIDEATQFQEEMIDYLITRNRMTIDSETFKPFVVEATNPGNVGHMSFKNRFIDIGPQETAIQYRYPTGTERTHYFIKSRLTDNQVLMKRDPFYADRLSTSQANKRMLLEGDWDFYIGQVFTEFRRDIHVVRPFVIPKQWERYISFDWGVNKPFAVNWYAVDFDSHTYMYRELYMNGEEFKNRYNVSLTPRRLAKVIMGITSKAKEEYVYCVADPSIWNSIIWKAKPSAKDEEEGESIAEIMIDEGLRLIRGDNDRINGLNKVRDALSPAPSGYPWLRFFENCKHNIAALPALQYSQTRVEDVDTNMDDHGYDSLRYYIMSRPIGPDRPVSPESYNPLKAAYRQALAKYEEGQEDGITL